MHDAARGQVDEVDAAARHDTAFLQAVVEFESGESLVLPGTGKPHDRKVSGETQAAQIARAKGHGHELARGEVDKAKFAAARVV